MSKPERLLKILTALGARRLPMAAKDLAEKLDVTERTIYRDIDALRASGAEIEGEPGFGYVLGETHIPPLNFTENEIYAVLTGLEMVGAFTDDALAKEGDAAKDKILAVLDYKRKAAVETLPYRAPRVFADDDARRVHAELRGAILEKRKVDLRYVSVSQVPSERVIWPLGLIAWFGKWTLTAWCEERGDYRNFRTDLIRHAKVSHETFETGKTCSLDHFLKTAKRPS